ncbi:MAG TPA: hypothetical protein VGH80_04275 [Xanthomonadaceae bacterium]|jgi:hypothetical protein
MRLILVLALSALSAATSAADDPKQAPRQFIEESIVTYPTALGSYTLGKDDYDPARIAEGVSLNYRLADAPDSVKFDIYVYPLGRVDTAKAVTDAMVEIEGEIRTAEQRKLYSDVKFGGDAVPFDVAEPAPSLFKPDGRKNASDASPANDAASPAASTATASDPRAQALIDVLHATQPPTRTVGRKRALTMKREGTPCQSLAYVFYRNLFLISVRASTPVDTMPNDRFNALVDRAVQDLVPAMDIRNFGDCGVMYISVDHASGDQDKDKDKRATNVATQLVSQMGRVLREGCSNKPGPKAVATPDHGQQALVYPPQFWK